MLQPKRVKWRKQHRPKVRGKASRGNTVVFGEYGLQAAECGWISNRAIEAVRVTLVRDLRKGGKLWIRIFPDRPYTKKPLETRMGKGKGDVEGWMAVVKKGTVMFEVAGITEEHARDLLRRAAMKLPVKCRFVIKGKEAF